mmetsp:Transcript_13406/g.49798  ORF Transcript_13406/g.49798 Transcript_13406/m.49798 type:complete len:300 (+) Transcript_13406:7923-8822(+)
MTVKSRASAKAWVKACCAIAAVSSWASFASSSKSTRAERSAKEVRAASSQSMVDVSSGPGQDTASKTSLRPRTTPHRWYHCASDPSLPESVSQRVWPTSTRTMRGFRVRTALSVLHADCRDSSVLLLRFRSKGPKACSLAKDDASIVLSRGGAMCSAKCVNTAAVATGCFLLAPTSAGRRWSQVPSSISARSGSSARSSQSSWTRAFWTRSANVSVTTDLKSFVHTCRRASSLPAALVKKRDTTPTSGRAPAVGPCSFSHCTNALAMSLLSFMVALTIRMAFESSLKQSRSVRAEVKCR